MRFSPSLILEVKDLIAFPMTFDLQGMAQKADRKESRLLNATDLELNFEIKEVSH